VTSVAIFMDVVGGKVLNTDFILFLKKVEKQVCREDSLTAAALTIAEASASARN
jgi:hypothetical protein